MPPQDLAADHEASLEADLEAAGPRAPRPSLPPAARVVSRSAKSTSREVGHTCGHLARVRLHLPRHWRRLSEPKFRGAINRFFTHAAAKPCVSCRALADLPDLARVEGALDRYGVPLPDFSGHSLPLAVYARSVRAKVAARMVEQVLSAEYLTGSTALALTALVLLAKTTAPASPADAHGPRPNPLAGPLAGLSDESGGVTGGISESAGNHGGRGEAALDAVREAHLRAGLAVIAARTDPRYWVLRQHDAIREGHRLASDPGLAMVALTAVLLSPGEHEPPPAELLAALRRPAAPQSLDVVQAGLRHGLTLADSWQAAQVLGALDGSTLTFNPQHDPVVEVEGSPF